MKPAKPASLVITSPSAPHRRANMNTPIRDNQISSSMDVDTWRVAPEDDWDVDNTVLDQSRRHGHFTSILQSRVAGDLDMPRARLPLTSTVNRRSRQVTPTSVRQPSKVSRIICSDQPPAPLIFDVASQDMLMNMQSSSSSNSSSCSIDFESWDIKSYQAALTLEIRGMFWKSASQSAKVRITAELQKLPASSRQCARQLRMDGFRIETIA